MYTTKSSEINEYLLGQSGHVFDEFVVLKNHLLGKNSAYMF